MSKLADRLNTLNVVRAANGKAPLKSWKASAAALEAEIAKLSGGRPLEITKVAMTSPELLEASHRKASIAKIADDAVKSNTPALSVKVPARAKSKKTSKPAKKAPTTKSTPTGVKSTDAFFALLVSLDIDPKQARATLRRKGFNAPYDATKEIKAALATDARKK